MLKSEKEEEANRDRDAMASEGFQPDGARTAPLFPGNPSTPPENAQLADDLTDLTASLKKMEDVDTRDKFWKQADRLVRQYCRLVVMPTSETAVTQDLRSSSPFYN